MRTTSPSTISPTRSASFAIAIVWILFLFITGVAVVIIPPVLLVAFFTLPLALLLAAAFPAAALFLVLVVTFGLLPPFIFASLPLGNATVRPPELLLIMTFALVFIRGLGDWGSVLACTKPLRLAFAVITAALLIGLIHGKLFAHYPSALSELRQYFGWLALPVALWLAWHDKNVVHRIAMIIALIASTAMLFQLLTGIQIIYGFRGAEELAPEFQDVKRSAIGGGVVFLCYAGYYLLYRLCDADRGRFLAFLALLIVIGGLAATFTRGIWLGFFVGGLVFLSMSPRFRKSKALMIALVAMVCVVAGLATALVVPRVGNALVDRVTRVADEGGRGTSFGYRIDENRQAFAAIRSSPILGKGLGAQFKTVYAQAGATSGFTGDESSFIHNTYLNLWVKLGLLGLLYPLTLIGGLYFYLRATSREVSDGESQRENHERLARKVAAFCCLITTAIYGMSSNEWAVFTTLAPLSCLIALIVTARRHQITKTTSGTNSGYRRIADQYPRPRQARDMHAEI
jgi:O-antigen ligase